MDKRDVKTTNDVAIVVPCYNEEKRFKESDWLPLASHHRVVLYLVNDGSCDQTLHRLNDFAGQQKDSVVVIDLPENKGKAEAVRQGLVAALDQNHKIVGYADADMATPTAELWRLIEALEENDVAACFGCRISKLGSDIKRKHRRHYLGRVFATAASISINKAVYDTQCGAKFFKNTEPLKDIVSSPFESTWAFDVELLGRLLKQDQEILEIPIRKWQDVAGSKLKFKHMAQAGLDLIKIAYNTYTGR